MAGKNLTVYLTSDVSKFRRGLRTAESDAKGFGGRMRRIGKGVAVGLAGAAAVGVAAAVNAAQEGIQSAIEDESSQKKLERQAKNSAKATDEQVAALEDYVKIAQERTGLDDSAIRGSLARFLRSTKDITDAQKLNDAAMSTSLGTAKELGPVADAVAKAYDGNAGALKRIGINIPAGDKVALLDALNSQFAGAIADDAGTYAGKIRRVGTAWSEVGESFGKGVLDNLGSGNDKLGTFDDTLYDLQPKAEKIGAAVGILATNLASVAGWLGPVIEGLERVDELSDNFLLSSLPDLVGSTVNMGKRAAAQLTGNAAAAYDTGYGRTPQTVRPGSTGSTSVNLYDPRDDLYTADPTRSRSNVQVRDGRSNARGAQRDARTGNRP